MSAKIYLNLLFLCGILCQEIFTTLADKDTNLSSDSLVRKRRVINHLQTGRSITRIDTVNYIVRIKAERRVICAGAILSHYIVITAAPCVFQHLSLYQIYSNAAGNAGYISHNVTTKVLHSGNPPHNAFDGIALITVDPPFVYGTKTGHIELYPGYLPAGTQVTVYGWGNMFPTLPGPEPRKRLVKIILPILHHAECQIVYEDRFNITDKHICTYHEQQYCANDDVGAPLVYSNRLVGIHIWKDESPNRRNPDVYINLNRPDYSQWIRQNTLHM